jgi:predicted Zn-dependent peptidase
MMSHLRTALLTLATFCLAATFAAAAEIPVETYTLPNGLTVILHRDPSLPRVAVNLWYRVGSADEKPGRTGFAHLFET